MPSRAIRPRVDKAKGASHRVLASRGDTNAECDKIGALKPEYLQVTGICDQATLFVRNTHTF